MKPLVSGRAGWQIRPNPSFRQNIDTLKRAITSELKPVEFPTEHYFSKGVYGRKITIPAEHVLVGKIHKHQNLNIVLRGRISIYTEEGIREFKAGDVIVSPPGVQRAGYAIEETVWMTVHGTDETDLDVIEETFIAQTYPEYLAFCETLKLKGA